MGDLSANEIIILQYILGE